jgi:putative glutamine amidotransferase
MRENDHPRIGVSISVSADNMNVQSINETYVAAIYDAHGLPIVIPVPGIHLRDRYGALAERVIEGLDGLLLTGGPDIDAGCYGEENFSFNGAFTEERDFFELELCKTAMKLKKPILGICRGEQLLNVAMGGTLFQDITKQHPGKDLFLHQQKAPSHTGVHDVDLVPDSRAARILLSPEEGRKAVRVNSFHHQAVKEAAPGFRVTAVAGDGIVEAIEPLPGGEFAAHPFVIGVQWHPERMYKYHASAARLFAKFAEACQEVACQ